jgi:hypothetical protein
VTFGALFNTATKVMKATHANRTLRAVVGYKAELSFIPKGDLPFHSFHARICLFFVLLAKFTNCHPGNSLIAAIKVVWRNVIAVPQPLSSLPLDGGGEF